MEHMRRYSHEEVGYIKFPPSNTGDFPLGGGMYVTLTVFEKKEISHRWTPALIAAPRLNMDDSLMGAFGHQHGPYDDDQFMETGMAQCDLLAHITMGSTGQTIENWIAQSGNLTEDGWRLWNLIHALYADHELWLLTWLDT